MDDDKKQRTRALIEQAVAAQKAAEPLLKEAEGERKGYAQLDQTIAGKMEVAYHKSLSAHFLVTELWDALRPSSRLCAYGHCSLCAKKMSTWVATLPPGKPLLFWMDLSGLEDRL